MMQNLPFVRHAHTKTIPVHGGFVYKPLSSVVKVKSKNRARFSVPGKNPEIDLVFFGRGKKIFRGVRFHEQR